jgi:hypothetical protein
LSLELDVEIGTPRQKQDIEEEFHFLYAYFAGRQTLPRKRLCVYFPSDFKSKVRELTNSANYKDLRSENLELAVAKTTYGTTVDSLVISPALFTETQDTDTRAHFYFHELTHICLGCSSEPPIPVSEKGELSSVANLLYAEYLSDRNAFDVVQSLSEEISDRLLRLYVCSMNRFFANVSQDACYQKRLCDLIRDFKYHQISFDEFIERFFPIARSFLVGASHLLAYLAFDLPQIKQEQQVIARAILTIDLLDDSMGSLDDMLRWHYGKSLHHVMDHYYSVLGDIYAKMGISMEDRPEGLYIAVDFV